ncbi:PepSY-associated TM helix domain-containing protein [Blastopirellula marina]|uniref:PepSY domain-containing protein n=1 Tax=Blastopirellula marina TaxID=124 RepID=A0A2S8F998_9BACT|nr:PepSY-associated TM helix domain-containing protein [Blastopirellula marina]PQO28715.1 PepSY domain-containing protein [Blastopirellula marina]PTL41988.1 PepSY domain-containing protein [Blastopirellula marina]
MKKPSWRRIWLKTHQLLGLTIGLLFALAGLTGSILVFEQSLDQQLNRDLMLTENQGQRLSLAALVELVQPRHAALGAIDRIAVPRSEAEVFQVRFTPSATGKGKPRPVEVYVDPYTGETLGQRSGKSGIVAWIYDLHAHLLTGWTGRTIMGIVALTALVLMVSGLLLWWPLLKGGWRVAWGVRRTKFNFDLHKVVGLGGMLPLLLIAFTGVYLGLPSLVKPVIRSVSSETRTPKKVASVPVKEGQPVLNPDQAVALALQRMPGSELFYVDLPEGEEGTYKIFVRQPGEVGQLRGVGRIWLDQYSGEVLATHDWEKFSFADTYFRIQLPLHNGDAFGMVGRGLFCVAGLAPAILYVTGFLLWWRKKRSKARKAASVQTLAAVRSSV